MKTIIILSLYVLGLIVYAIWIIGDEVTLKAVNKAIEKDPEMSAIPNEVLNILLFIGVLMVSIIWPINVLFIKPIEWVKNAL